MCPDSLIIQKNGTKAYNTTLANHQYFSHNGFPTMLNPLI